MSRISLLCMLILLTSCASPRNEKYVFLGNNHSEITLETDAPNWFVKTYISTSETNCEGLKSSGILYYDEQLRSGGILGSLQKINPLRPDENISITQKVPQNSVAQIMISAYINAPGFSGRCGPVTVKFQTGNTKKFKAYIALKKDVCSLTITDTDNNLNVGKGIYCN